MYTIEKIEENIVLLEDRDKKIYIEVNKDFLPLNIKEGDILDVVDNKYVINSKLTSEVKKTIKNKFKNLIG